MSDDIDSVLRRRGHRVISTGRASDILWPLDEGGGVSTSLFTDRPTATQRRELLERYLSYFSKASFRKLVSMLVRARGDWVTISFLEQTARGAALDYLQFLTSIGVVETDPDKGQSRLTRSIDNLGPSLEHYVASVCEREFSGSAEWGVQLEGLPRAGGDYDVLAWLDPTLVYVECKSGKLSGIEDGSLAQFLQRTKELAPDLAVLVVDTDAPISDFVTQRLNPIILDSLGSSGYDNLLVQPVDQYLGVWFGLGRVYVTNSQPNIPRQLRRCLQFFHANVKQRHFFIPLSVNYV